MLGLFRFHVPKRACLFHVLKRIHLLLYYMVKHSYYLSTHTMKALLFNLFH